MYLLLKSEIDEDRVRVLISQSSSNNVKYNSNKIKEDRIIRETKRDMNQATVMMGALFVKL